MRSAFLAAVFAVALSLHAQRPLPPAPPTITGEPYSATRVVTTYQTLGDGTTIQHEKTGFIARDSSGREVQRAEMQPDPLRPETKRVSWSLYDPNTRTITRWCSCGKVAMIYHYGEPRRLPPEHDPGMEGMDVYLGPTPASRLKYHAEELPPKVLMGVTTRGSHVVRVVKAGLDGNDRDLTTTVDSWYSPELRLVLLTEIDDPVKGKSRLEFTGLSRDEPPAGLFQIPPGYTERESPTEAASN